MFCGDVAPFRWPLLQFAESQILSPRTLISGSESGLHVHSMRHHSGNDAFLFYTTTVETLLYGARPSFQTYVVYPCPLFPKEMVYTIAFFAL